MKKLERCMQYENSMLYETVKWHVIQHVRIKKNFVSQDSVLELNSRLNLYYHYPVAEMDWNNTLIKAVVGILLLLSCLYTLTVEEFMTLIFFFNRAF